MDIHIGLRAAAAAGESLAGWFSVWLGSIGMVMALLAPYTIDTYILFWANAIVRIRKKNWHRENKTKWYRKKITHKEHHTISWCWCCNRFSRTMLIHREISGLNYTELLLYLYIILKRLNWFLTIYLFYSSSIYSTGPFFFIFSLFFAVAAVLLDFIGILRFATFQCGLARFILHIIRFFLSCV